jgi:transglutaminase-like putative cysteine protease
MSRLGFRHSLFVHLCFLITTLSSPLWSIDVQPVSEAELKMTSEPKAPGAPAIILFREVDRDDSRSGTIHEDNYYRIKIFTQEGRKYADIEIPFVKGIDDVIHIQARTIRPDGSIVPFDGNVFEKPLAKARGLKFLAKTFTLPAVEPGCIIEYSYTLDLKHAYSSHWILSESLYTKEVRFSLRPFTGRYYPVSLRWSWHLLPPGSEPKEGPDKVIRMNANDIAAFQTEDYMPPPNELKSRVDFMYETELPERDPDQFWKKIGKRRNDAMEGFVGKQKAMEQAVAQIIAPTDSPDAKLHKIYDRVQHLRNTSYELRKTEQEEKRDKEKVNENVEDIWKRGYGNGQQLTWLFLALARAAGLEAYGCWVSDRRQYFFAPKTMQSQELDANVVLVKLNGKDLYFDPGGAFTPYGLLKWSETGVRGIKLDKEGGSWIMTTLPASSESQIVRSAKFTLSDNGNLDGKLTVTYTGLAAMYVRLENRNADDVARKKFLEDSVKAQIAGSSEVQLTNQPDWIHSEPPVVAEFDIKMPEWASNAGKRTILPAGVFIADEKKLFEQELRIHPIYFEYPYEKSDDLSIELPPGWQVSSLPQPATVDGHIVAYHMTVENGKGMLHVSRKLSFDFLLLEQKYYPALRNFFQTVRSGDEGQIVLQPGNASASN